MPTIADYKAALLREIGAGLEGLPDPVLAAVLDQVTPYIDTYWEMNRWRANIYPELQYLYVKRMCIDVLLGQNRDRTNTTIQGATVSNQAIFDNLGKLRVNVQAEIDKVELRAQGSRGPALGTIASSNQMDAAGRIYDPLSPIYPTRRRIY